MSITAIISAYEADKYLSFRIKNLRSSTIPVKIFLLETGPKSTSKVDVDYYEHIPDLITIYQAWNRLIKLAETPYVVTSNCDDLIHPQALELQIKALSDGADIAYYDYYLTQGYYQTWDKAFQVTTDIYRTPPKGYSVGRGLGPFPMWKKSLHDKFGYFDEKLHVFGDSWFWTLLAKDPDIKWGHIPQVLGACARVGNNLEMRSSHLDEARLIELRKLL